MKQHKAWFKIILNPILRILGWSIISVVENDIVIGYEVRKYPEHCNMIKNLKNGQSKIKN